MTKYDSVTARFGGRDTDAATPFDVATARAQRTVRYLLQQRTAPTVVADALITQALALWAAETGRHTAACELLRVWAEVRDGARP